MKANLLEDFGGPLPFLISKIQAVAWTYLQLPLQQWGAGNVYLLVFSSWKVNIAENPIAVFGVLFLCFSAD